MTTNDQYREAFEAVDYHRFAKEVWDRRTAVENEYRELCVAEQKRRQPKKKKNFADLPEEWYEPLRQELLLKCRYAEDEATIKKMKEDRQKLLAELADSVELIGDPLNWWKVETSCTSTYSTQTCPGKYAKAIIQPLHDYLNSKGLIAEIRWSLWFTAQGRYSTGDTGEYQVWANCPLWMADAAERQITWEFMSRSMGRTVNLKVYNPFMSDALLDKHFAQSY